MTEIISEIFVQSGFIQQADKEGLIFSDHAACNFWVVIAAPELEKVVANQTDIFDQAKRTVNSEKFDKNANLLILHRVETIRNFDRDAVLQIEEDPYHFKKTVLLYCANEVDAIKLEKGSSNLMDFIVTAAVDEKIFTEHKKQLDNNPFQSLVYRIYHKLPFLPVKIKTTNNLKSLESINGAKLKGNELNAIVETGLFNMSVEELDSLPPEEILLQLLENE